MKTKIMSGIKTIVIAIFTSSLLSSSLAHADTQMHLTFLAGVPYIQQDRPEWCWAATTRAILQFYGTYKQQCEIANTAWNRTDCCSYPDSCNQGNSLNGYFGVSRVLQNFAVDSSWLQWLLPWDGEVRSLTTELDPNWRPFFAGINEYDPDGVNQDTGHAVVVNGYELTYQGDKNVIFMDPQPGIAHNYGYYIKIPYDDLRKRVFSDYWYKKWDETLLTLATPWPSIIPWNDLGVSTNGAILGGSVNPKGTSTAVYIDWGTSTNYVQGPVVAQINGSTSVPVSLTLNSLAPNTTYYYRMRAVNSQYTVTTGNTSFKTAAANARINGVCGCANGQTLGSNPAYNPASLCSVGSCPRVSGYVFGPWTWTCIGANGGSTASCSAATSNITEILTLIYPGPSQGTITSSSTPNGVPNCNCAEPQIIYYLKNTTATLTATPDRGKIFTGWSGACSGRGPCTVTMNSAQSVTATFVPDITPILNLLLDD